MKTKVREIAHKGSSSIIEWVDDAGNVKRSTLPSDEIIYENRETFVKEPDEGAPYGEAWEEMIRTRVGPKGIADLLRKNGIWTLEDYVSNTAVITSVFNEACSQNHQQFREAVLLQVRGRDSQ